jgi:ubiquinone/menaquinone biosynthesis C-methylase UbiE
MWNMIVRRIKTWLFKNRYFNFNQVERDLWVRRQAASVPSGNTVLDVGAGTCPYRPYFSHCTYRTQDFVGLGSDQLRDRSGYGAIDYVCDATQIPVPDNEFDVVLCTEVLEHVPEPIKVVREMARVLKPGGKLLLTAPLGSGIHQEPYHYYGGYTPWWYRKFLAESGFGEIQIEPNGGFYKQYGQESLRFVEMLAPWRRQTHRITRWLLLPLWLASLPWLLFVVPLACHFLDRLDGEKFFTIGYHVVAVKGRGAE